MSDLARIDAALIATNPEKALADARKCAEVLVKLVHERNLFQVFGKKKHLLVEAWQTVGHFYGVTAKITDVRPWTDESTGEQGFEATAQAIHMSSGNIVSEARAICSNFEPNWSTRPKYEYPEGQPRKKVADEVVPRFQLMSMAETRAISKVMRNVFAFVVVLAGFDPTPAAEMTGSEREQPNGGQPTEQKQEGSKKITDSQRKRIFGIASSKNVPMPEIVKIINKYGFKIAADVTVDKYDSLVKEIQDYKS